MTRRMVEARATRRARAAALLVVGGVLAGCAASGPPDSAGIEADVRAMPGVTDVESGIRNTGAPGSYELDTDLVVDADGAAHVADVLRSVAAAVARRAPDVGRYSFSVSTASAADPSMLDEVSLEDAQDEIGLPGTYSGDSLELTGSQLASIAESSPASS